MWSEPVGLLAGQYQEAAASTPRGARDSYSSSDDDSVDELLEQLSELLPRFLLDTPRPPAPPHPVVGMLRTAPNNC